MGAPMGQLVWDWQCVDAGPLQNHSVLTTLDFFGILLGEASRLLAALGRFDAPELASAIVLSFLSMIYARAPEVTRHTVVVQTISAVVASARP